MDRKFNGKDIKYFLKKYGNDDVYYSHEFMQNGTIEVKYFPHLLKFIDSSDVGEFIKTFDERPNFLSRYVKVMVLTDKFAYLPDDNHGNKNPLVKNYQKFLKEYDEQHSPQK